MSKQKPPDPSYTHELGELNNISGEHIKYCSRCNTTTHKHDLIMKMGGLLCPNCRVIIIEPHTAAYWLEFKRRIDEGEGG